MGLFVRARACVCVCVCLYEGRKGTSIRGLPLHIFFCWCTTTPCLTFHTPPTILACVFLHRPLQTPKGLATRLKHALLEDAQPSAPGLGSDKWHIALADLSFGTQLGAGQFGVVYKGVYKGRRTVAIKTMKQGAMDEEEFTAEAEVMKCVCTAFVVVEEMRIVVCCCIRFPFFFSSPHAHLCMAGAGILSTATSLSCWALWLEMAAS